MKLITEIVEDVNILSEEDDKGNKNFYIEGVFLQSEIKNRNGRVYPKSVMDSAVNQYRKTYMENGRAFGELSHPDSPQINLDRVSHLITDLKEDGNNYYGKAKILKTPNGNIVRGIMEGGGKLGVSSRGMGSLSEKNGTKYVGSDFMIATAADVVADPSAPDAFVDGIFEGKEWVYVNGEIHEKTIEQYKKEINNAGCNITQKKKDAFIDWLRKLG